MVASGGHIRIGANDNLVPALTLDGGPARLTPAVASAHVDMESAIVFEREAASLNAMQPARAGGDAAEREHMRGDVGDLSLCGQFGKLQNDRVGRYRLEEMVDETRAARQRRGGGLHATAPRVAQPGRHRGGAGEADLDRQIDAACAKPVDP